MLKRKIETIENAFSRERERILKCFFEEYVRENVFFGNENEGGVSREQDTPENTFSSENATHSRECILERAGHLSAFSNERARHS